MLVRVRLLIVFLLANFAASAQPTAGFNVIGPAYNCNPAIYSFVNTSTGTGLTYEWNFGVYPDVNSVFPNPSTTYLNCGTFQVKLMVTDTSGLKDSLMQSVNVRCSPTANFSTEAAVGCLPHYATFSSTSVAGSGSITDYVWDFGDGNSGTGENPTHTYDVPGCKNVTLLVTNSYNCVSDTTISSFLCIYPPPIIDFTSNSQTSCSVPFTVNYEPDADTTATSYSYQWIFQGGVPPTSTLANPVVTYTSPGRFTPTLIITDMHGCSDTVVKDDFVTVAVDTANFTLGASPRCAPGSINVSGLSTGSPMSWVWTVSQPASIDNANSINTSIGFPVAGSYDICLTATYSGGCTSQKCSTVEIKDSPTAKFGISGSLNTCIVPNAITFLDSSSGSNLNYSWSFPGGSPSTFNSATPPAISYTTCGNYSASLLVTDSAGCSSTDSKTNFLQITCPNAAYTISPSNGCLPLTAYFRDTSTGNPVSWLWNFDDPNSGADSISTLQHPVHTFYAAGCYTIELTTTNAEGCSSTYSYPAGVCAGWKPHANFSGFPPYNCAGLPIYFTDSSTGTWEYTQYVWIFHDSAHVVNSSTSQNPNHIFWDVGIFDITLIVSNYGCADTITKDDYVQTLNPLASPRAIPDCRNPFSVILDGSESPGAQSYSWIILDGTPANATTPTVNVTLPGPGDYNAALYVVNDSNGCSDLENIVVHITGVGADFTADPVAGCQPLQSCFSNASLNAVSYEWRVTDSSGVVDTTSTSSSPCFTFENAGTYSVQLIVTDVLGCIDTLYKPDYIKVTHAEAKFTANPINGCAPLHVNFQDSSIILGSGIAQRNWNFGNVASGAANVSGLENPFHIYNEAGNYPVILSITDSNGCTGSSTQYIQVNKPVATFTNIITPECEGTESCFTLDAYKESVNYHWDFGDGITADTASVCHLYRDTGHFNVILVATDTMGCSNTATKIITNQFLIPHAQLVADTTKSTCPPLTVNFTSLSTGVDSLTAWQWDFGDGQISSLKNPFHIYTVAGKFTVTLIASNFNGCSDTIVYPDYIDISGPTAYIATAPASGCVPNQTCMSAISASATTYTWNMGDGMVMNSTDSICYTYTRTGSFYPELILSDGSNCIFSLPMGRVDVVGTVARFVVDSIAFCEQGIVNFTDSSSGTSTPVSWNWNFGDPDTGGQNNSAQQNPSHFFASPGIYRVMETIVSADGCIDSTFELITVYVPPLPSATFTDTTPCQQDSVFFIGQTNPTDNIINYSWNFGDASTGVANTSDLQNAAHYYSSAGTYQIIFSVTDTKGCSGNDSVLITIHPKPQAAFTAYDTCLNTQPIIFSNNSQGANNYSWSFGDGNNSSQFAPSHTYQDSGMYVVQLIAQSDYCSDSISVPVEIFSLPYAAFTLLINAACETEASFPITNNSTGAVSYSWDFGNQTFSALENPVAAYNSDGEFSALLTAVNEHSCIDTASKNISVYPNPDIIGIDIDPAEGCQPLEVSFNANVSDANFYTWHFGTDSSVANSSSPQAAYIYSDTGAYTLSLYVSSIHDCKDTLVLTDKIKVHGPPIADFDVTTNSAVYPYDGTVAFINRSKGADNYYWEFGDGANSNEINPSHRYERVDWFSVLLTATNQYGCEDTASKLFEVIKKALYVPNALQPEHINADGLVNVWKPIGIGLLSYRAQVFDQWGKLLWESESLINTQPVDVWDGTYMGKACPQDVYVWKIDAVFVDGSIWRGMNYSPDAGGGEKTIGSITLIR